MPEADADQPSNFAANKHREAKYGDNPQGREALQHDLRNRIAFAIVEPVMPTSIRTIGHPYAWRGGIDLAEDAVLAVAEKLSPDGMILRRQLNLSRGVDFPLCGKVQPIAFEIGHKLCPAGVCIHFPHTETVGT